MAANEASEDWRAALNKDAARVVKKQKLTARAATDGLDAVLREVSAARSAAASGSPSDAACLSARLREVGDAAVSSVGAATKELTAVMGKLSKAVEKHFAMDVERALWTRETDDSLLSQVIVEHLVREGRLDLARLVCSDTGAAVPAELEATFRNVHSVVTALHAHDVTPALDWAATHGHVLRRNGRTSALEFTLYKLQFLDTVQREGRNAAVKYARAHFRDLDASHAVEVQRLMGSLLYAGRLQESPYADLWSENAWDGAAHTFARECCSAMGFTEDSPLAVTVDCGTAALPTLVKMNAILTAKGQSWQRLEQLPLEVDLPQRFAFHSVFACPVARDQSSPDNPPMILPCGLVLCRQSIQKLARSNGRSFKCPYCPIEVQTASCKPVFF